MAPTNDLQSKIDKHKETRAQRVAREKLELQSNSNRKIAIRKLTKAITESSLSTQQIEKMYEQFQEVTA